jgi:predicted permease
MLVTVAGVAPQEFEGLMRGIVPQVWVALTTGATLTRRPEGLTNRGDRGTLLVGRLREGATVRQAQEQLGQVAGRLHQAFPDNWTDVRQEARRVTVIPEQEARVFPNARGPILGFMALLMTVAGLVLLIACANLANLLLARAEARRREVAVRISLGADRRRLLRQLLTESVMLASAGAVAGLLLAVLVSRMVSAFQPPVPVPVALDMAPDARVLAFVGILAVITTLGFGLLPALQATRLDLAGVLKDGTGAGPRTRMGLRDALVTAQVAVSVLLLAAGGLFIRTLQNAQGISLGFDAPRLAILSADPGMLGMTPARSNAFWNDVAARVGTLPAVQSVSLASTPPLSVTGRSRRWVEVEGYRPASGEDMEFHFQVTGPGHFHTIGLALARGREFTDADRPGAPGAAVVNETFAARFWPGQNPVGRRISVNGPEGPWLDVVGVARDAKMVSLSDPQPPLVFVPLLQHPRTELTLHVRTAGDPAMLVSLVRQVVRDVAPDLPVTDASSMAGYLSGGLLPQRIAATLLGLFGLLGLSLAGVGLYGVVSYWVSRRSREIGVRVALGAGRRRVIGTVLREGMKPVALGLAAGLVLAFGLTRFIGAVLYGISPADPVTFGSVVLVLLAAALLATWVPARRAASVDPMTVLRSE